MPTSHDSKCKEKEIGSAENEQDSSQNNPTKERFDNHDNEKDQAIAGDDIKPAGDNLRDSQNEQSSIAQGDGSDNNLQTEDNPNKKSKSTTPTSREDECEKQQAEIMDVDDGQLPTSGTQKEGDEDLSSNNSEGKDLNRDDGETCPAKTDNGTSFADESLQDEQYRQSDISEEDNTDSNLENIQDPSSNNSGVDLKNDDDKAKVQTDKGTAIASEGSRDEQSRQSNIPEGDGTDSNLHETLQNNYTAEDFDKDEVECGTDTVLGDISHDERNRQSNIPQGDVDSSLKEEDSTEKSKPTTPTAHGDDDKKKQADFMDINSDQRLTSDLQKENEQGPSQNSPAGKDLGDHHDEKEQVKADDTDISQKYVKSDLKRSLHEDSENHSPTKQSKNNNDTESKDGEGHTENDHENNRDMTAKDDGELDGANSSDEEMSSERDKSQNATESHNVTTTENSGFEGREDKPDEKEEDQIALNDGELNCRNVCDEKMPCEDNVENVQESPNMTKDVEDQDHDKDEVECGTDTVLGDISQDEQNRQSTIQQGDVNSNLKDNSTEKNKPTTPTAHENDGKETQADIMDINSDQRSISDLQKENEQGPSQSNPAGNDLGDHHDEKEQVKADNGRSVQPNISQRDVKSDSKQSLDEDSENHSPTKQSKHNNETESKDGEGHTENDHDTTMTVKDDGKLDGANSSDEEMSSESDKNKNATESHNVTTTENSGFEGREDKPDEKEEDQIALNDGELGGPNVCNEKILSKDNVKNVQESPNMTKDVEDQDHSAISNASKPADGPNETQVESMEVGFSSDGATDVVQDLSKEENIQDQKQNDIMTSKQEGEPDGTKVERMKVDNERLSSESRETKVDQDALEKDSALPRFDDEGIKNDDTSVYESTGCAQFKSQIPLPRNTEKEDGCVKKDGGEISKEEVKGSRAIQSFSEVTAKPEGDTSKNDNSENLLTSEKTGERIEGSGQQKKQPIEKLDNHRKTSEIWDEKDDIEKELQVQGDDHSESKSMSGQADNKLSFIDKIAMINMASGSTDDSNTNQEIKDPTKDNVVDLETQDDDENDCKTMDGQNDKLNKISLPNTAVKEIGVDLKAQADDENKNMTTVKDEETDEVQERIAECKNSQPMRGKPSDKNKNSKHSRSIFDPLSHEEQEFTSNDKKNEDTKIETETMDHTFKEQETEFERKDWHNNIKQDLLKNESKDVAKKEFDEQIKPFESIDSDNGKNREIVNENRLSKNGSNVSETIVDQNKVDSEITKKQQKEIEQHETPPNEGQIEPESKGDKSIEVQEKIQIKVENTGKKKGEESKKSKKKNKATEKSEKSKTTNESIAIKVVESNDSGTENNRENVVKKKKKKRLSMKKLKFWKHKNKKDMTTSELTENEDGDQKKQKGKGKSKKKKKSIEVQEEVQIKVENTGEKKGKESKKSKKKNEATGKSEKSKTTNESIDAIKVVESNDSGTENNRENVVKKKKKKRLSMKKLKFWKHKNKKEDMTTSELTGNEDSGKKKQKGKGKSKKKKRSIEVQEEVQIKVENPGEKRKESKKSKKKSKDVEG